jgi:hypothetical protein
MDLQAHRRDQEAKRRTRREMMLLLQGLTHDQVRTFGMEALRNCRRQNISNRPSMADPVDVSSPDVLRLQDFGVELTKVLAPDDKDKDLPNRLQNIFAEDDEAMGMDWMSGVLEFLWWLTRAGLAVELRRQVAPATAIPGHEHGHSTRYYPTDMRLTTRGVRLLESTDDNPMLPGFLDRIRSRCPGIPESVVALLVDARACFDHSLMRPAVVLMGVAYEVAVEQVMEILVIRKHYLEAKRETAKDRIERITKLLHSDKAKALLPNTDARTLAKAAYDFAEQLRQRRNDAAHSTPAMDFTHNAETEEYFISAGRFLPAIWSLAEESASSSS